MTPDEVHAAVCGNRPRLRNEAAAHARLALLTTDADATPRSGVYRCPLRTTGPRHWHAGPIPPVDVLVAAARMIRGLDPADPTPKGPTE